VILTRISEETSDLERLIRDDNRRTIETFGGVPVLAEIRSIPRFDPVNQAHWNQIEADLATPGIDRLLGITSKR
jgi:hypothetical protein